MQGQRGPRTHIPTIKNGDEVRYVRDPFLYDRVKVEECWPGQGIAECLVTLDDAVPEYEKFYLKLGDPPLCEIEPCDEKKAA